MPPACGDPQYRLACLLRRGHKLVEEYPDRAVSWFGVGCYYMATQQYEQARRFFAKATQLDKDNAYAWIGFGHAFAEQVKKGFEPLGSVTPVAVTARYSCTDNCRLQYVRFPALCAMR